MDSMTVSDVAAGTLPTGVADTILVCDGRPAALIVPVRDAQEAEELHRAVARARFGRLLAEIQAQSVLNGTDKLTDEEIEAEIQAVRQGRA